MLIIHWSQKYFKFMFIYFVRAAGFSGLAFCAYLLVIDSTAAAEFSWIFTFTQERSALQRGTWPGLEIFPSQTILQWWQNHFTINIFRTRVSDTPYNFTLPYGLVTQPHTQLELCTSLQKCQFHQYYRQKPITIYFNDGKLTPRINSLNPQFFESFLLIHTISLPVGRTRWREHHTSIAAKVHVFESLWILNFLFQSPLIFSCLNWIIHWEHHFSVAFTYTDVIWIISYNSHRILSVEVVDPKLPNKLWKSPNGNE